MNQEIKQRIDLLKKGKIPNGYKKAKWLICPNNWTIDRLNSYLSENKDKNVDGMYTKDDVLSVSGEYGVVNQIELMGRSYAGESILPYHIVETGDIVYTKSPLKQNPYGIIKLNEGKTGIVSTLYAVYYCKDPIVAKYLNYFFQVDNYLNNYLLPLVKKGAKNDMKVNNEDVLKGKISFPPLEEQQKIAEILMQCDKVIELYEQEIEELKKLKKAYLRKMFPKKGENVPELRFDGFTDPWEQRKLGDICMEMLAGGDIDKEKIVGQGKYPVIANALTNDGIVGFYEHDYRVKSPAVTITGRGDVGHAKARKVDFTPVVRLLAIRTNHDVDFIENAINTLKVTVESTGVPQLTVPQLEKLELFIPPTIAEEQIIGAYLRQLDNLITLHERKLEEQKNQKKSLMQLLLTGIVRVKI